MRLAGSALVAIGLCVGPWCCVLLSRVQPVDAGRGLAKLALTAGAANSDGLVMALARAAASVVGLCQRHREVDDVSQNVVGPY